MTVNLAITEGNKEERRRRSFPVTAPSWIHRRESESYKVYHPHDVWKFVANRYIVSGLKPPGKATVKSQYGFFQQNFVSDSIKCSAHQTDFQQITLLLAFVLLQVCKWNPELFATKVLKTAGSTDRSESTAGRWKWAAGRQKPSYRLDARWLVDSLMLLCSFVEAV